MPEQEKGRDSRILHRNLLLPCNHLPLEIPLKVAKQPERKRIRKEKVGDSATQPESSSDEEDDWHGYFPAQPVPVVQSQADENTGPTEREYDNEAVNESS